MNWDELKTLVDAAAEGKTLQQSLGDTDEWYDISDPWVLAAGIYKRREIRIKPEQREFWVSMRSGMPGGAYFAKESAAKFGNEPPLRVREVLED